MISGIKEGCEYKINGRTYVAGKLTRISRHTGCWATVSVQKVTDRSYSTLYIRLDNSMELLRTDGTTVEVKRIKRNF